MATEKILAGVASRVRAMKKGPNKVGLAALAAHHVAPGSIKMKKPLAADTAHIVHGKK